MAHLQLTGATVTFRKLDKKRALVNLKLEGAKLIEHLRIPLMFLGTLTSHMNDYRLSCSETAVERTAR